MGWVVVAIVGLNATSAIVQNAGAKKRRIDAEQQSIDAAAALKKLEDERQEIINPYENIKDLSSMLSNPMANLGVATQAAEMQIEQADISLANTLDTLRATGASAGGATALAQAALQSKKGVSASIEKQEAQNEQLKAKGEQMLQQRQMSEAQRVQNAQVAGETFVFGMQEERDMVQLDRVSAQLEGAQQRQMQAEIDQNAAWSDAISNTSQSLGALAGSDYFETGNNSSTTPPPRTPPPPPPPTTPPPTSYNANNFDPSNYRRSDRRLKTNINKVGVSPRGFNIYTFEYKNKKYGKGVYQGVMSSEMQNENVIKDNLGYDMVNYSNLDVEFKKISYEL